MGSLDCVDVSMCGNGALFDDAELVAGLACIANAVSCDLDLLVDMAG